MKKLVLSCVVLCLVACTWVKPDAAAKSVVLASEDMVVDCKQIGQASSSVKHRLGALKRNEEKVARELVTLAKNEAARLGGNAVVPKSDIVEGVQEFTVFSCARN